jgi:hypothetical protein
MKLRDSRSVAMLTAIATVLALVGLFAPAAFGASKLKLVFLTQPGDTQAGATITGTDLTEGSTNYVRVQLQDANNVPVTNSKAKVSFNLISDAGGATTGLHVTPQVTDASGIATFGEGTLSISTLNEPEYGHYHLVPITVKGTFITGPASVAFDIWEDGDSCSGGNDVCEATVRGDTPRGGMDTYNLFTAGSLGASELPANTYPDFPPTGACPDQRVIFGSSVFANASLAPSPTGTAGPVFLTSHITKQDFRDAGADFGQAHVEWCFGLKTSEAWTSNGIVPTEWIDPDGNVLYVAQAPACPNLNPSGSAPCITDQFSDGMGGNITQGWIPGGDPVRRT